MKIGTNTENIIHELEREDWENLLERKFDEWSYHKSRNRENPPHSVMLWVDEASFAGKKLVRTHEMREN